MSLVSAMQDIHRPLLVLVDEYDRFANKLLFQDIPVYRKAVKGVSGDPSSSFLRTLFEALKPATSLPAYRTFTTGLTPLALNDASGVNYINNISHQRATFDLVGFKKHDVEQALKQLVEVSVRDRFCVLLFVIFCVTHNCWVVYRMNQSKRRMYHFSFSCLNKNSMVIDFFPIKRRRCTTLKCACTSSTNCRTKLHWCRN